MSARTTAARRLLAGDAIICERLETADSMGARMRGLLGRRGLEAGTGLWITPCSSIHMFFMRFAIDAVFVDTNLVVTRIHQDLGPWKMARGGRGAHSVFELPAGTSATHGLAVGQQLRIDPAPA